MRGPNAHHDERNAPRCGAANRPSHPAHAACVESGTTMPATTILIAWAMTSLVAMRHMGSSHGAEETKTEATSGSRNMRRAIAEFGNDAACAGEMMQSAGCSHVPR